MEIKEGIKKGVVALWQKSNTRTFSHGKVEIIHIGGGTVGRLTLEPGWRWSTDVKPLAHTEWCEAPHFQYQVSGRLHVLMSEEAYFVTPGDLLDHCENAKREGEIMG